MDLEAVWNYWGSLFAGLGPSQELVLSVIRALQDPMNSALSAGVLLFLGLAGMLWFLARIIWPARRLILMAGKAVEGTADQAAFTASFPRFDRALNETPLLRRPWGQFRAGIIVPPQSARAAVRHHLRAGDYLNLRGLIEGGFNFQYFQSWAGYFFGIGILLSLLAILADIHLTSQAALSNALAWDAMLAGLSVKFLPLVAGAITGLCLSASYKWSEHRLSRDLFQLSHVLEERIQFTLPSPANEQFRLLTGAVGPASESAAGLSLLPEHIRSLSQEIVAALARVETQMTETMPGRVGDAMQPLSEALDMLGKRLSDSNAEALRQAVGELAQGLHARAAEDLDALSEALIQARNGLEEAGHSLRDASSHASEKLSDAGEALAEQMGRAGQYAQQALEPLPQHVTEFGNVLTQFNQGLSHHAGTVASAAEMVQRAIGAMDELLQRPRDYPPSPQPAMAHGPAPVMDFMMVEDLSRAARDMSSSLEAVSEARRLLKRLGSRLRQPATSLLAQDWEQHREALGESDEVLDEVLENFRAGASQQRAGLDAAIDELETRLENLFRNLDTGASRLDGALQMMRRQAMTPPADPRNAPAAGAENESAA
ncbi:MAG TPA: hypothetical protein VFW37_07200 [Alphaproteobacteria bacterium]|nr:hypothetical protein [Alphaproteobacteria bacterium]